MLWLLFACSGSSEKESSSNAPPLNQGDDTAAVCEGNAPVITALHFEAADDIVTDKGTFSAFGLNADVEDDDGDLTKIRMDAWFDETVDGVVDTSGAPPLEGSGYHAPNSEDCHLFMITFGQAVPVDNVRMQENTLYEFAAIIYDAANLPSEPAITSGTTPAAK